MNTERSAGYYWCKFKGEWLVASWRNERWTFEGYSTGCSDTVFDEINETRIEPPAVG